MSYIARLYTSPAGRAGRLAYNLFFVVPYLIFGITFNFVARFASPGLAYYAPLAAIVITVWPCIVVNIKRLHDIGLPGWLLAVWWFAAFTISFLRFPHAILYGYLVSIPFELVLMIVPGTNGPNQYGAKP
jgi:uncharacterized membrane protein YhaH (DUF805 family)